ncbi:MAG: Polymer-forming cytoskeletal [Betaproteobacteria bacterium ADurb.Bin341]|nr:MAG: Polymer-forming cytoskeletal [Betaproteobacteria bacterium ADurb.Bin341]
MFGKRGEGKPQFKTDSLIATGTRIEGNIRFSGGLRIEGEVKGNVEATGDSSSLLYLSEKATIEGEVTVAHFVANGTVAGKVTVSDTLELQAGARILGDVEYALIEMQQGAVIEGRLVHRDKSGKAVELKLASAN